jgi:hypothetical protein
MSRSRDLGDFTLFVQVSGNPRLLRLGRGGTSNAPHVADNPWGPTMSVGADPRMHAFFGLHFGDEQHRAPSKSGRAHRPATPERAT